MRSQASSLWCTTTCRRVTRAGVATVQSGSAMPSRAATVPAPTASRGCRSAVAGYSTSTATIGSGPVGSLGAASCTEHGSSVGNVEGETGGFG